MHCVNCGTELIPGKRFCHLCGTQVVSACPNCGASIEPGFRFCPDCGARIAADPPAPPAVPSPPSAGTESLSRLAKHIPEGLAEKIRASSSAATGERKLVTVLFCDLAGSTAIAERLDPEEYHDLLERYLELAFREIYRFEGIVNQLAGDGMMALFGAPLAHEDAPERALQAALGIREALTELNQRLLAERRVELHARIGIHTGPVVVGTVGNDFKMDYTAIGDTTNLAARLEALAEPGTILISEATQRLVRGFFQLRPVGPFTIKGKRQPVKAFEVLSRSELATPMTIAAERGLTPLVGRHQELAQLRSCFERLTGNLAQVVAVVGAAGSGKSRLLYEFKQQLADKSAVLFEGRCASISQVAPYAMWTNMLRQYFALTRGDSADATCDKVADKLLPDDAAREDLYPYLCRLLAVPVGGLPDLPVEEVKRKTFEAVAGLVMSATARAPVVILVEDLQWIDEPSREMLDLAVSKLHSRIMLVVTHRPDYQPLWRTQAAFTQLSLRPLSDDETTEIIRALAGGTLPAELEERIRFKADGNPFVAEEITRSLVEQGFLLRGDENVRLTRPVADIRIPDTVHELIGARLDRLGASAKRVVQVAAVLGRQFQRAQLAQLLGGEGLDVFAELDGLEQRGVIHRKNLLSDDEYRFGESLTQEVAYEALLLKERRQLHERVGRLLEAATGDGGAERSALIAHHLALGDDREKAVNALLRAARDTERLPSYPDAVRFYRQAWELADAVLEEQRAAGNPLPPMAPAGMEAALGMCRLLVLYGSGDGGDVQRAIQRARELAEALGNQEALAGAYTFQGMIIMGGQRERFAEGLPHVEEGLAIATKAGLTLNAISISRALAFGYMYDGRFELARATFHVTVNELERLGHREQLTDLYLGTRFMCDTVRYFSDDLQHAQDGVAETYELAVRAGNRTIQANTAGTLAYVYFARAEYEETKRWADTCLQIAEAIGNVGAVRSGATFALAARTELGESTPDPRYFDLIEQGFTARSDMAVKSHFVAEALIAVGEVERAQRFVEIAYAHAGGRLREAFSLLAFGEVMQALGPRQWIEAERWYKRASALAETIGARSVRAAAALGAGRLAARQGDRETSLRLFHEALAISREVGFGRRRMQAERLLSDAEAAPERRAGL